MYRSIMIKEKHIWNISTYNPCLCFFSNSLLIVEEKENTVAFHFINLHSH